MDTPLDIDSPEVIEASERLLEAAASGIPCAPIRDLIDSTDMAAAYLVQERGTYAKLDAGARIVGRKVGLTSEAVQKQIGVDQPDFGVLFDDFGYGQDDEIPFDLLLQPKAEAEVAFMLRKDLAEGPLDMEQVRDAVAYCCAAIEIVDSRISDWDITFADTVADNGSSAMYVLGSQDELLEKVEPRDVQMTMTRNGEQVSTGSGAACLGDPLNALVWLAQKCREYGEPLRVGQLVLSGALGPMIAVQPGDVVTAEITGLGSVTARFGQRTAPGEATHDEATYEGEEA